MHLAGAAEAVGGVAGDLPQGEALHGAAPADGKLDSGVGQFVAVRVRARQRAGRW